MVALGDRLVLHYHEHTQCSLLSLNPTNSVLLLEITAPRNETTYLQTVFIKIKETKCRAEESLVLLLIIIHSSSIVNNSKHRITSAPSFENMKKETFNLHGYTHFRDADEASSHTSLSSRCTESGSEESSETLQHVFFSFVVFYLYLLLNLISWRFTVTLVTSFFPAAFSGLQPTFLITTGPLLHAHTFTRMHSSYDDNLSS